MLILELGVGAAVLNAIINAAIAVVVFGPMKVVPMWGHQSIVGDVFATAVLLPLLTCVIVTPNTRLAVSQGDIGALPEARGTSWIPRNQLGRGLVLAALCTVAFAPAALGGLHLLGIEHMSVASFATFKAVLAALMSVACTPLIGRLALSDLPGPVSPAA